MWVEKRVCMQGRKKAVGMCLYMIVQSLKLFETRQVWTESLSKLRCSVIYDKALKAINGFWYVDWNDVVFIQEFSNGHSIRLNVGHISADDCGSSYS